MLDDHTLDVFDLFGVIDFVKGGGSVREADRRFFGDGRNHRDLIRRLVAESEG